MKKRILFICAMLMAVCHMQAWAQGSSSCETAQVISTSSSISADHELGGYLLWYSFTPTESGVYQISSCGHTTTVDNMVTVRIGSCDNPTQVANNDDGNCGSHNGAANTTFIAEANTTYTIEWYRYSGGDFYTWELVKIGNTFPVNFDIALGGGETVNSLRVYASWDGNYVCDVDLNVSPIVAYLPNGEYYAEMVTSSWNNRRVYFTVSGVSTTVSYIELRSVFTFSGLPQSALDNSAYGDIYGSEDMNSWLASFSYWDDYVSSNSLVKGETYYYNFRSDNLIAKTGSFIATDTVTISFADYHRVVFKVNTLSTDWVANNAFIIQNGEQIGFPFFGTVVGNPLQYTDTMYMSSGSYTLKVVVADTAHGDIPLTVSKDFSIAGATEITIDATPNSVNLVNFTLSNLPVTPTDTSITVFDEHGNHIFQLNEANLSCYLSSGSYKYETYMGGAVASNRGGFTVSGTQNVNISFAGYYKIDFDIDISNTISGISISDSKQSQIAYINYSDSDTIVYLPNGSYNVTIHTNGNARNTQIVVNGASMTVKYREVDTRFTIADLPENLMQQVAMEVFDRNGNQVGYTDVYNNFTISGLEKNAMYSYQTYPNGPYLLGTYTGTFIADTLVELTRVYHKVVANITAPGGRYLVSSTEVRTEDYSYNTSLNLGTYPPYTDTLYATNGSYIFTAEAYDTATYQDVYAYKQFVVTGTDAMITLDFTADVMPYVTIVVSDAPQGGEQIEVYDGYGNQIINVNSNIAYDNLPNGSYTYKISARNSLMISGAFSVSGSNKTINVSFADHQPVTFKYTLPEGAVDPYINVFTQNDIILDISLEHMNDSVTYYLPNGTYSWNVEDYYRWGMPQGEFTVSNAPVTLIFVPQIMYKVAFAPSNSTAKSIDYDITIIDHNGKYVAGASHNPGAHTDTLLLPAGSYTYWIYPSITLAPNSGSLTVSSGTQTINISFEYSNQAVDCILTAASGSILPLNSVRVSVLQNGESVDYFHVNGGFGGINLPVGTYTLRIAHPGYKIVEKTVTVANAPIEVELVMQSGDFYSTTFYVHDSYHNSFDGVTIAVGGKALTTNANGEVILADVPAGNVSYTISKKGYQSVSGTIYIGQGGRDNISIMLMPLYNATFNVYSGATGTTYLSGAIVTLQDYGTLTTTSSPLTFNNVAKGSHTYVVSKDGHETQSGVITVINDHVVKSVNMVQEQPYTIKVAVFDASASSIFLAGAKVDVTGQGSKTVTNDTIYFTGLTAGDYTVSVSYAGYYTQSNIVTLSPAIGNDRALVYRVDMEQKPANLKKYTVTFTVYDDNTSSLLSGASVALAGGDTKTTTNAPLSFVNVDSGDVIAYTISKTGYVTYSDVYTIDEINAVNDTVFIPDVYLQTAPRYAIEFKVYDGNSTTYLVGASVQLQDQATHIVDNAPLSYGNLLIGSYTYSVSMSGYVTQSGTLNVTSELDLVGRTLTKTINLMASQEPEPNAVPKNTIVMTVYPNPVSHTLYIKSEDDNTSGLWNVKLYNINGSLVKQDQINGLNGASISVEQLPSGLYILHLSNGSKINTKKIRVK